MLIDKLATSMKYTKDIFYSYNVKPYKVSK